MDDTDLPAWLARLRDAHDLLARRPISEREWRTGLIERWFDGIQVPEEWFA